jgi:hypothetical protein
MGTSLQPTDRFLHLGLVLFLVALIIALAVWFASQEINAVFRVIGVWRRWVSCC